MFKLEFLPVDVEPFIANQPSKGGRASFFSIQAQREGGALS